jgi:hypothetical protein
VAENLRVVMAPLRSEVPDGRAIVAGFELAFGRRGRAVGAAVVKAATKIELVGELIKNVRLDERAEPVALGTLNGELSTDAATSLFVNDGPIEQDASLDETFEQDGHRRPRRRLLVKIPDGDELELFLPDSLQVSSGHLEIKAKLTVSGALHADVDANDTLDVPLLPLRLTHAVFKFVDSAGKPLAGLSAEFEKSDGSKIEATADDFGELFLDASNKQTYRLVDTLPAEDERVAVLETSLTGGDTGIA